MRRFIALGCLALALPAAAQQDLPYQQNFGGNQPYQPAPYQGGQLPYGGVTTGGPGADFSGPAAGRAPGSYPGGRSSGFQGSGPGFPGGSGFAGSGPSYPGGSGFAGSGPSYPGGSGFAGSGPSYPGGSDFSGSGPSYPGSSGFAGGGPNVPGSMGPGGSGGRSPGFGSGPDYPAGGGMGNYPAPGGGYGNTPAQGGYSRYQGYPGGDYGSGGFQSGAEAGPPPGELLQYGIQRLTGWLSQNPHGTPAELRAFLDREIASLFDFDTLTRWSLGPLGRNLDNQQYARVRDAIRNLFLDSMARQLAGYPVGNIQYLRPRGNPADGEVVLGIQVARKDGYPLEMQFRLQEGPFGWKAIDVEAEGASAVRYYRQFLSEAAARYGVNGMLDRLRR